MKVYFSSAKYFLFLLNSLFEFNVRKTGIYLLLICISTSLKAQDISLLIKEADRLEAIPNEKQALAQFKEVLKVQPLNLYALTKCSELSSRVGAREKKSETRDTYNQSAIMFAKTAFKYYPGKDEACVAMGIAIGRSILNKSGKEKIAAVYDIKKYAESPLVSE